MRVYLSQTDDSVGSKVSGAPENDSFAVSFVHLELRRKSKKYRKVEESQAGTGLQESEQNYVLS